MQLHQCILAPRRLAAHAVIMMMVNAPRRHLEGHEQTANQMSENCKLQLNQRTLITYYENDQLLERFFASLDLLCICFNFLSTYINWSSAFDFRPGRERYVVGEKFVCRCSLAPWFWWNCIVLSSRDRRGLVPRTSGNAQLLRPEMNFLRDMVKICCGLI